MLTLVFFRAESVTQASAIFAQLFAPEQMNWWFLTSLGLKPGSLAVLLVAILTLFAVEWVQEFEPRPVWRLWSRRWIRWVAYLCVIYTIALFGPGASSSTFSSESLVRVGVVEAPKHRQEDDLEVEEKRPISDVVEVEFDPFFHLLEGVGLASPAVDLCPACDARFDLVTQHVVTDQLAVLLVVRHGVGPWPDDRHLTGEDVDELRQFIQRGLSEKRT